VGFKKHIQVLFLLLGVVSKDGPISVPHEASKVRISLATLPLQVLIVRLLPMQSGDISRGVGALEKRGTTVSHQQVLKDTLYRWDRKGPAQGNVKRGAADGPDPLAENRFYPPDASGTEGAVT
jgi:hypothetical protein